MKVWDSLRRLFGANTAPRALRNKPGGFAWIKGLEGSGCEVLNGRAVRTVRHGGEFWEIDPPQNWVCTQNTVWVNLHQFTPTGTVITTVGIGDEHLEPWKDDGVTDREVRELYAPTMTECPRPEIIGLPVREMRG